MKVYRHKLSPAKLRTTVVATLGKFDGLHSGHQKIFQRMRELAKGEDTSLVAIILWPHPLKVLKGVTVPRIYSVREQLYYLSRYGITDVLFLRFTHILANVRPVEFLQCYLIDMLNINFLVVGEDVAVGKARSGGVDYIADFLASKAINFEVIPHKESSRGEKIGSAGIREAVVSGDMQMLYEQLGEQYYSVEGRIVHGCGRGGSEVGFPTANVHLLNQLVPANGVYVTLAELEGVAIQSVTNVGIRPTIDGGDVRVECHFLDWPADRLVYGKRLRVKFIKRIRSEQVFSSISDLTAQIARDIEVARNYFDNVSHALCDNRL